MTGNWFGLRDKLVEKGVEITSSYVFDVLGNTTGGDYQATRYDHSWGFDSNFDLEKILGLKGLQFHFSWIWRAGQNLSMDAIKNQFNVTSIFGSEQFRIYGLYLDQTLFDGRLSIRGGRIATGDDFASSPIYWIYMNNAIDGNPISLPLNLPFITYPTATWGVRTILKPVHWFQYKFGIYNGDGRVGRMEAHGADFTLRLKRGVMYIQEFHFMPGQVKESKWLPGNYKLGMFYHSGRFFDQYLDVNDGSYQVSGMGQKKHIGNYGLYTHCDQMIYREEDDSDQGLTAFVVTTWAPANINKFPFFIDGGVFYKGLVPGRDDDIAAWGFAVGTWSKKLANSQRDNRDYNSVQAWPQGMEMMVEFTYKAMITKWLFIQPDAQIIVNPNGEGRYKNAFVVGTRVGVTF
ncbi:MAG: carbohydrate porin [Candidatus Omnitrophica bacterium]|nr:carbohydrate porin [Candidatus Omnitrophota bacterium]